MGAVDAERLLACFLRCVRVNSPSRHEGALAELLCAELTELGLEVHQDGAGRAIGGDTGNLYGWLPPARGTGKPLLVCAHMDTVEPTEGIVPVVADGWVRTDGRTILGADDKAGVAAALEMLHVVQENHIAHSGIQVVFTVAEEIGLLGSRHLDYGALKARRGFILDSGGPVGTVVVKAPAQLEFAATFRGHAAHAGVEPEKGVNAIMLAAQAIAPLPWGRLDAETTANIGRIEGGKAENIVPDTVKVRGELRSFDAAKLAARSAAVREAFAAACTAGGGQLKEEWVDGFPALNVPEDDALLLLCERTAARNGLAFAAQSRGGGSDANVLCQAGFTCVNLGMGMQNDHTVREQIRLSELIAGAEYLTALVEEEGRG